MRQAWTGLFLEEAPHAAAFVCRKAKVLRGAGSGFCERGSILGAEVGGGAIPWVRAQPRKTIMKKLTTIISAIAFGLALFQPMAASAKDKDQKEKGKGRQGNSDNRQQSVQQPRASAPVARSKGGQGRAQSVNVQQGNGGRDRARSVQNQTQNARSEAVSVWWTPRGVSGKKRTETKYGNEHRDTRTAEAV